MKLKIEFDSGFHHGSGFGLAGLVDRTVLRDHDGMPYLAGSALKGKFRFAALRWLNANGERNCTAPIHCDPDDCCKMCLAFGSPRRPGDLIFHNAYPVRDPDQFIMQKLIEAGAGTITPGGTEIRATTAIDRFSGRALPEHLFTSEVVRPGVCFEAEIAGKNMGTHLALLGSCAGMLNHFGAGSARGLGRCRYELATGDAP